MKRLKNPPRGAMADYVNTLLARGRGGDWQALKNARTCFAANSGTDWTDMIAQVERIEKQFAKGEGKK